MHNKSRKDKKVEIWVWQTWEKDKNKLFDGKEGRVYYQMGYWKTDNRFKEGQRKVCQSSWVGHQTGVDREFGSNEESWGL